MFFCFSCDAKNRFNSELTSGKFVYKGVVLTLANEYYPFCGDCQQATLLEVLEKYPKFLRKEGKKVIVDFAQFTHFENSLNDKYSSEGMPANCDIVHDHHGLISVLLCAGVLNRWSKNCEDWYAYCSNRNEIRGLRYIMNAPSTLLKFSSKVYAQEYIDAYLSDEYGTGGKLVFEPMLR